MFCIICFKFIYLINLLPFLLFFFDKEREKSIVHAFSSSRKARRGFFPLGRREVPSTIKIDCSIVMPVSFFMYTHFVLFAMGSVRTFLNRRNFIIMLMCIEVMLLAANLVFLTASVSLDDINRQLLALWVMTAAAAETAIGLALCVLHYRMRSTLDVEMINLMKG